MGPSGSGKSTLMHCLAGLDSLTSGADVARVTSSSRRSTRRARPASRRDNVGFIFQAFNLVPTLTAAENITLPVDIAGRDVDRAWMDTVVGASGSRDRLKHKPSRALGWSAAARRGRPGPGQPAEGGVRRRAHGGPRLHQRGGAAGLPAPRGGRLRPDDRDGHARPDRGELRLPGRLPRRRPDRGRDARRRARTRCSTASSRSRRSDHVAGHVQGHPRPAAPPGADRPGRRHRRGLRLRHLRLRGHPQQGVRQPLRRRSTPTPTWWCRARAPCPTTIARPSRRASSPRSGGSTAWRRPRGVSRARRSW